MRVCGSRFRKVRLLIALAMEPLHIVAFHTLARLTGFGFAEWAEDPKRSLIQHPSPPEYGPRMGLLIP
jgi:hypothetical protein